MTTLLHSLPSLPQPASAVACSSSLYVTGDRTGALRVHAWSGDQTQAAVLLKHTSRICALRVLEIMEDDCKVALLLSASDKSVFLWRRTLTAGESASTGMSSCTPNLVVSHSFVLKRGKVKERASQCLLPCLFTLVYLF
jgi:hypothetical protein